MNNSIFDLIEPEGQEGYMELAEKAPKPKEKSILKDVSDFGKTFLKGGAEGIMRLGRIMGPLPIGKSESELQEEQEQALNKLLPTEEGFTQSSIRRGLREAPSLLAFPGSSFQTIPRSIAAGFLGESAKELGLPEWAQSAAELTAYIGPDVTKKLLESGKDKDLIAFAKKIGMTDEEITPLIQSNFKQKWLSKLSPKRGSTEKVLQQSKQALNRSYNMLQQSESAVGEISEQVNGKLINDLYNKIQEMPRSIQNKIQGDLQDLLNNKITGRSLINFYADINSNIGANTKQISLLKKPIRDALSTLSPELASDFDLMNKLYSKYYPIASKLKPNLTSDIISAAEALGIFGATFGITLGHYPSIVAILGEQGARKFSQQMLLNPRFQQLSKKMIVAINNNKYGLAKKITQDIKKEVDKISPQMANQIQNFSEEEFENILKGYQKKNPQ